MLHVQDPEQRPSAAELQGDPFVRSAALPELLIRRMADHMARQRPVGTITLFGIIRYRVYWRGIAEKSIKNTLPWHEKSLYGTADCCML